MDCQRGGNGYAPNPSFFREIKAWADLRQVVLRQWQLDALIAMDLKRRELAGRDEEEMNKPADEAQVSERPMSAALFDAIFPSR